MIEMDTSYVLVMMAQDQEMKEKLVNAPGLHEKSEVENSWIRVPEVGLGKIF